MCKKSKLSIFLLFFFLVCFLLVVSLSYAAPPKVAMGYIEEVSSSSIKVKGQYYNTSGVPLYHTNGARVTSSLLQVGNAVEILIEDGKITRITINNQRPRQ